MSKKNITIKELSEVLGYEARSVRERCKDGRIPAVKKKIGTHFSWIVDESYYEYCKANPQKAVEELKFDQCKPSKFYQYSYNQFEKRRQAPVVVAQRAVDKYNEEHGTCLSYGMAMAMGIIK